jgi:hypothetical protein
MDLVLWMRILGGSYVLVLWTVLVGPWCGTTRRWCQGCCSYRGPCGPILLNFRFKYRLDTWRFWRAALAVQFRVAVLELQAGIPKRRVQQGSWPVQVEVICCSCLTEDLSQGCERSSRKTRPRAHLYYCNRHWMWAWLGVLGARSGWSTVRNLKASQAQNEIYCSTTSASPRQSRDSQSNGYNFVVE